MFHASNIKCLQRGKSTFFPADIPSPKMETEDYLRQSIGNILAILIKLKNQLP